MHADDTQLSFCFDYVIPLRGALSIRQVAAILGRIGAPSASHPNGKPNDDYVQRLIEEGKILAQIDTPKHGANRSYRITASSLRVYIATTMSRQPQDYRQTLENAALNLPPAELRKLAAFAEAAATAAEERLATARGLEARANRR